jgi:hypothetical protein
MGREFPYAHPEAVFHAELALLPQRGLTEESSV